MDKKTRNKKLSILAARLDNLNEEVEEIKNEIYELENQCTCDVCGKEFNRFVRSGFGGAVFSESELGTVTYNGKEIDSVCGKCLMERWVNTNEQL